MKYLNYLHEEFMDYCTSPLSPKLNGVKEVDTYWDLLGMSVTLIINTLCCQDWQKQCL